MNPHRMTSGLIEILSSPDEDPMLKATASGVLGWWRAMMVSVDIRNSVNIKCLLKARHATRGLTAFLVLTHPRILEGDSAK